MTAPAAGTGPDSQSGDPSEFILRGGVALTTAGWEERDLAMAEGRVQRIHRAETSSGRASGEAVIDISGCWILPGFVDLQVNGGRGHDLTAAPEDMWALGTDLVRQGVTAYLPTLISPSPDAVLAAQEVWLSGPPEGYRGARILGLHLEGPLLAPSRRGAHPAERLCKPSDELITSWDRDRGVRMVTVAPELPGTVDTIRTLAGRDVVVSLGHSDATFEQAVAAIQAGASAVTHLYNAMSRLEHRSPGLVGAALAHPTVVTTLVVDRLHVHPGAVEAAWRAKGPDGFALITDAVTAREQGSGVHTVGGVEVTVGEDGPRTEDGKLAGSVLTMDAAVRNLVAITGCKLEEAALAASTTPARLLGEPSQGALREGRVADLTVVDQRLRVVATAVGGRLTFSQDANHSALREGHQ